MEERENRREQKEEDDGTSIKCEEKRKWMMVTGNVEEISGNWLNNEWSSGVSDLTG